MRTSAAGVALLAAGLAAGLPVHSPLLAATAAAGEPAAGASSAATGSGPGSGAKIVATIQGSAVGEAELEQAAAAALRPLQKKMQQVLATALKNLIDTRLLDLESARLGITQQQLLAREVDAKATPPTDAEVAAEFEQHRAQAGASLEQAAPQIRRALTERRRQEALQALLAGLRARYQVQDLLAEEIAASEAVEARALRAELEKPGFPAKGPAAAPVKIVLFSDFECPFCSRVEPTLRELEKSYGDRLQLVFRQFPLPMHAHARKAAEASLCAADQGKFWEMHDLLFADQKNLELAALDARAAKLGLDGAAFDSCLDSGRHAAEIQADIAAGGRAGVAGTPTLFVNGHLVTGAMTYADAAKLVERELAAASGAAGAAAR
jgi:protein-disulfide isomerase